MSNFDNLIQHLQDQYSDEYDRGKRFERVCKWFLSEHPYYGQEFSNVWLWEDSNALLQHFSQPSVRKVSTMEKQQGASGSALGV